MAWTTSLTARRVAPGVPAWDVVAGGVGRIGTMTNLPLERAWCLTAGYCGRHLDYRAASREAVLLALRCAVDAIDHAMDQDEADGWVEDEDGDLAAQRAAERRAEDYAMRREHEEPWF
jgi:hypothetical protein